MNSTIIRGSLEQIKDSARSAVKATKGDDIAQLAIDLNDIIASANAALVAMSAEIKQ